MSAALADLAIVLLYLAILAPGAIALTRPSARLFPGAFYTVFFLGLVLYYFGLPGQGAPVALARVEIGPPPEDARRACGEMIRQAEQAGVILDRSATMLVSVDRRAWRRLSPDNRVALTACLDRARPADARAVPLQIVQN